MYLIFSMLIDTLAKLIGFDLEKKLVELVPPILFKLQPPQCNITFSLTLSCNIRTYVQ